MIYVSHAICLSFLHCKPAQENYYLAIKGGLHVDNRPKNMHQSSPGSGREKSLGSECTYQGSVSMLVMI